MKTSALERFLRYVTIDTRADDSSAASPSTPGQLVLMELLASELRALGLDDVVVDGHGYLMASVPATSANPDVPVIGFIAHVDTSPEMSGAGVRPIVHRHYDGRDIVLPDDPSAVLRASEDPALAARIGDDIVTASGTTLLGADDKAGVAEIMAAVEYLVAHPELAHGKVRIAFTPDEEIGRGADHFDVERFGATCAYTLDGGSRGELELESFSADLFTVTFKGFNTHPGYAKGRMVNSIRVAADFIASLPRWEMTPETTAGDEGYVHPYDLRASVDETTVKVLIRDFITGELGTKRALLEHLAREAAAAVPGCRVETTLTAQYRNMREVLDRHPAVIERARAAMRRAGIEPVENPIRGGTDGSRLSFMGLPTPNLFAGEHNFHSRLEWVSGQDMDKAVEVIVELCRMWELTDDN
ncbi:MAG TPA: peptidase T [Vicinamibacterales bacterium]|nr:peptidase T [Vicinamibacterales bacterium]